MFFLTLSMALSGMTVLPSLRMGVTSTSSQLIGACGGQHVPLAVVEHTGPFLVSAVSPCTSTPPFPSFIRMLSVPSPRPQKDRSAVGPQVHRHIFA